MIDVDFSDIEKIQATVSALGRRLSDATPFFNDFASGLLAGAVREVFDTEGYGTWDPLVPETVRAKRVAGHGSRILERTGTYRAAASALGHPGNVFVAGALELVFGVSGDYFGSRFGENYPERHEEGLGVPMRSVFGLLAESDGFDAELAQRLEAWASETIAATEREFGL